MSMEGLRCLRRKRPLKDPLSQMEMKDMAPKNLTKSSVDRIAKPAKGRTEVSDVEKGLFLHVRSTGVKSWVVVYRVADIVNGGMRGARVKHSIGNYPVVSIEQARAEARRIMGLAAAGRDTHVSGWSKALKVLERFRKIEIAGLDEAEVKALHAKGIKSDANREAKSAAQEKLEAIDLPNWRLHDLRHTFITRARDGDQNDEGEVVWSAALDVVQATVNHSMSTGVTKLYDHGDIARRYRIKRRELAQWWADKLDGIVGQE